MVGLRYIAQNVHIQMKVGADLLWCQGYDGIKMNFVIKIMPETGSIMLVSSIET